MPTPTEIRLPQSRDALLLSFDDGLEASVSAQCLRVHSPSAEVQGHGPGQDTLQLDKEGVRIEDVEAVGRYAVKLRFSDGHDTGLFTWDFLHELAREQEQKMARYRERVQRHREQNT